MASYLALVVDHSIYDLFPLVLFSGLCSHILSLGGQLVLLVRLAHVYGSLFTLQQWILTVDDKPGLAGPHGAGQRLLLTRVSHQRV